MKAPRFATLILTACLLGACVPRRPPPPPVAVPPPPRVQLPRPAPAPPPPPPAPNVAWEDAALTPGTWRYQPGPQGSAAFYGFGSAPSFTVRCQGGQMFLVRAGAAMGNTLTFRATSFARSVNAAAQAEGLTASVSANDPLLDTLVFSRGRFAVEAPGLAPLVLPTWPELARVVEDCRRSR